MVSSVKVAIMGGKGDFVDSLWDAFCEGKAFSGGPQGK
jgi:hypothetical protein